MIHYRHSWPGKTPPLFLCRFHLNALERRTLLPLSWGFTPGSTPPTHSTPVEVQDLIWMVSSEGETRYVSSAPSVSYLRKPAVPQEHALCSTLIPINTGPSGKPVTGKSAEFWASLLRLLPVDVSCILQNSFISNKDDILVSQMPYSSISQWYRTQPREKVLFIRSLKDLNLAHETRVLINRHEAKFGEKNTREISEASVGPRTLGLGLLWGGKVLWPYRGLH